VAKNQSIGEILHFNAIRYRVTGSGVLRSFLTSLDDVSSSTLPTITMASPSKIEPTILANFIEQRAKLELGTTAIDEVFVISKIVIFVRPIASGYPQ
jgi:hypothetical protein